jgi:hypothetical protein
MLKEIEGMKKKLRELEDLRSPPTDVKSKLDKL